MRNRAAIVLVVEDDDDVISSLCDILEEAGYECWLARTGDEAVQRVTREQRNPHVVLLDLKMPGMPVPEFLAFVRGLARPPVPRVVLMTAARPSEIPHGFDIDAVLMKPFGIETLLSTISRLLAVEHPEPPAHAA